MKAKRPRRRRSWLRRSDAPWSNLRAAILTGIVILLFLGLMVFSLLRHERLLPYRRDEWVSLPWDPSWPAMPSPLKELREDVARAVYAFAGTKPEVVQHIPCFCGCRLRGHGSVHDCYVKHRSLQGVVTEWDEHGLTCPLATDITGDVMLWHDQGKPLRAIRWNIDNEFGARGPATDTPLPR